MSPPGRERRPEGRHPAPTLTTKVKAQGNAEALAEVWIRIDAAASLAANALLTELDPEEALLGIVALLNWAELHLRAA